jgi:N-acylglucosamine 2-epimerase
MAAWLRAHLFGHVLPFWERYAFDEQGGLFTCVSDAGAILSTDKWLWSQWRAVWVFSRIYRTLDRDERWLRRARDIAEFCLRHGWVADADGWALLVAQDGRVLRGFESTYVDAFAVYGLAELYAAGGDDEMLGHACRTADAALKKLAQPYDRIPHFPYPIPRGAKPQGIPMLWSFTLAELGATSGKQRYMDAARALSNEIFRDFYHRERDMIMEFVRLDGRELESPEGRAVVPGHVIENMWFQLKIDSRLGRKSERGDKLYQSILRHLALGWDQEYGGLRLAIDADGKEPVGWSFADTKLWWPQTEALYATLLGWQQTRQSEFFRWYERIWGLCLNHYANWQNGEWRQKLDRSLSPINDVVALPVKDPFHLPRSLILQIELLEGTS